MADPRHRILKLKHRIRALKKEINSLKQERFLLKRALVWADEIYMGTSMSPHRIAWHDRIDCLEIHK